MEIHNEEINDLLAPENQKLQVHENVEVRLFELRFMFLIAYIVCSSSYSQRCYLCSYLCFGLLLHLLYLIHHRSLLIILMSCITCFQKGVFVAGLREEIVVSPEQVLSLMTSGESMNDP